MARVVAVVLVALPLGCTAIVAADDLTFRDSVGPNCVGLATTCGTSGNENCCASAVVTGGTYNRSNDPSYPATVSDFRLDRFEITVGRFRAFVAGFPGNKPMAGAGGISTWDTNLPADQAALMAAVKCDASYQTWTDTAGANENLPMNCITWYEAFAFCAWDGGSLPTEAEWNYAAAGGAEQRFYPWSSPPSSMTIDASYAVYECNGNGVPLPDCVLLDIPKIGAKSPTGDGRWGQADLAGSIQEWNLDWNGTYPPICNNCAGTQSGSDRVLRGGGWPGLASTLLSSYRYGSDPTFRGRGVGARCARAP